MWLERDLQIVSAREGGVAPASPRLTKERLLDSVSYLITARNALSFTLSEVAAHAGTNAALVKYYFGNKNGMLMALLERDLAPQLAALAHLLTLDLPPVRKMRIHLEGMIRAYFRYPYINRLTSTLMLEGAAQAQLVQARFVQPVLQAYRQMLEEGVQRGVFRPVDPLLFYVSAVGMCDQFAAARLSLEMSLGAAGFDEALTRRYVEHVCGLTLGGILQNDRNIGA